jgi:hypothetical protein
MTTFYLGIDLNLPQDIKIIKLKRKLGYSGFGLYIELQLKLAQSENYELSKNDYADLAYEFRLEEKYIKDLVENFDLFEFRGDKFFIQDVKEKMGLVNKKREAGKQAGIASGIARKNKKGTVVEQSFEPSLNKERKEIKEIKENNINKEEKKETLPFHQKIEILATNLNLIGTPTHLDLYNKLIDKIPNDKLDGYLDYLINNFNNEKLKNKYLEQAFHPVAFYNWYFKDYLGYLNTQPKQLNEVEKENLKARQNPNILFIPKNSTPEKIEELKQMATTNKIQIYFEK